MSTLEAHEPECTRQAGEVELLIEGRSKHLGGFTVRRVLPAPLRTTVGPFIFFDEIDEMGPADFPPGRHTGIISLQTADPEFERLYAAVLVHGQSPVQPVEFVQPSTGE